MHYRSFNHFLQECWDKDRFSDDFMGSLQFTAQDLVQFEAGPKWCRLQHVKTGEILMVMKRIPGDEEDLEWSHLDEASRPLHLVGESKSNTGLHAGGGKRGYPRTTSPPQGMRLHDSV